MSRILAITPVHNEAPQLERVIAAMERQTLPPALWVVVDDGSQDQSWEIVLRAAERVPFMRPLRLDSTGVVARDRLALAMEARAFNAGLAAAGGWDGFDVISKIDGDVMLPADFFERCVSFLDDHPHVGIVGCRLIERIGDHIRTIPIPDRHVHGATKVYRQACLVAIGGVEELLGWDAIDETRARMEGFTTYSLPDLVADHLRPTGGADGIVRGRARHGFAAYVAHYPFYWVVGRAIKIGFARPRVISGVAFLGGWLRAWVTRVDQVDDPRLRAFARFEMRRRVLDSLRGPGRGRR
jgi:poly-beta-1,6-N-acetyl-D-glucosamine synthase